MGGRTRKLRNRARREGPQVAAPVAAPEPVKTEAKAKKKSKKETTTKQKEL